jgi:hypothetical protein
VLEKTETKIGDKTIEMWDVKKWKTQLKK